MRSRSCAHTRSRLRTPRRRCAWRSRLSSSVSSCSTTSSATRTAAPTTGWCVSIPRRAQCRLPRSTMASRSLSSIPTGAERTRLRGPSCPLPRCRSPARFASRSCRCSRARRRGTCLFWL
eukprot:Amastigsp_a3438_9.p4 type:complete len:120 gc:universal Amastigsp_a3438_9:663-1022(+)